MKEALILCLNAHESSPCGKSVLNEIPISAHFFFFLSAFFGNSVDEHEVETNH